MRSQIVVPHQRKQISNTTRDDIITTNLAASSSCPIPSASSFACQYVIYSWRRSRPMLVIVTLFDNLSPLNILASPHSTSQMVASLRHHPASINQRLPRICRLPASSSTCCAVTSDWPIIPSSITYLRPARHNTHTFCHSISSPTTNSRSLDS